MANTIQDWDSSGGYVDDEVLQGSSARDYVAAESVVIAAGPPALDTPGFDWSLIKPIGVVQSVGIAQSRQLQQLFEIGSKESFFIPGKTFVNANFSRVLVHGPNLLRAFYSWYSPEGVGAAVGVTAPDISPGGDRPGEPYPNAYFYINLASELFSRPIGLLLYMQDTEKEDYAASYLENCFIQSHQMSVSAQQTLIMENVQVRSSKIIPITSIEQPGGVIL